MTNLVGKGHPSRRGITLVRPSGLKSCCWIYLLMAMLTVAKATPILDAGNSVNFFTNAGSRLLASQLNVDLARIQIYPTNQYTPAVHRLLQVAANVYDATSTNFYPSVFRPVFSSDGTNVFITGYKQVVSVTDSTDSQLALPVDAANVPVGLNTNLNVFGVPWIIGVKKGFPNFNKFDMESAYQLTRKLQVTRPSTNDIFFLNPSDYNFNQMFNLSLSNQFGVECWNSYTHPFNDSVAIYVRDNLTHAVLTNDEGFSADFPVFPIAGSIVITNGNVWPGYNPVTDPLGSLLSFQIPLYTNVIVIPNSIYRFNNGAPFLTTNLTLPYEPNVTVNGNPYPQPHWWLTASNEVQVFMLDTSVMPNRVIDYVQLSGPNSVRDLTSEIISNYDFPLTGLNSNIPSGSELWNTNLHNGFLAGSPIPVGLISQIEVSLGDVIPSAASGIWDTTDPTLLVDEIAGFSAFMGYTPPPPYVLGEAKAIALAQTSLSIQAPYMPKATVVQHISWQANDPPVHYLASDLNWPGAVVNDRNVTSLTNNSFNGTLGQLNQSYRPWGGNPLLLNEDQNPYNLALKDPLVWRSDNWDFPTNECLSGEWLGRVHRGTPWQTVYLKSQNVLQEIQVVDNVTNYSGTNLWMAWTGDTNVTDAVAMAPVQDWHVASLLAHIMNPRHLQDRFSVNDPRTNDWLRLLSGLTVLTNNLSDNQLASGAMPGFETLAIRPHSPQARQIADAIESARVTQSSGFFHDAGDVLEVPELSDQSPFLNWNDSVQQQRGINDEAYEILPSELLPLLRADSVSSIKPAKDRAVVRFAGYDDHSYAIEVSSDLVNWTRIGTNRPVNGVFGFTNSASAGANQQFYRSVLLQ